MKSEGKVHRKFTMAAAVIGVLLAAGCAGDSVIPAEKIAGAEKAIEGARGSTATTHAPAELKSAEDNLAKAKAAMEEKKYDTASRLADSAAADADLAQAKASTAKSKKATDEMRETVRSLRKELDQTK